MEAVMTFDTLQYAKKAKGVGFTEAQAEFQAEEIAKVVHDVSIVQVTKRDLLDLEQRLEQRLVNKLGMLLATGLTLNVAILGTLIAIFHK